MSTRTARLVPGLLAAWAVALALTAAPAVAQPTVAAQPARLPAWQRARLDGRLDGRTREAVERVADSAFAAGLPAEVLITKALEGASKGAPHDGIVNAVRSLAARLATARRAFGTGSLVPDLAAGADALEAGVEVETLEKLRRDRGGQPLAVTLGVLTDLIASKVPVDVATKHVLALTEVGAADEQLVAFQRAVERDIGIGAPPAAAALLRAGPALSIVRGAAGANAAPGQAGALPRQKP